MGEETTMNSDSKKETSGASSSSAEQINPEVVKEMTRVKALVEEEGEATGEAGDKVEKEGDGDQEKKNGDGDLVEEEDTSTDEDEDDEDDDLWGDIMGK